MLILASSLRLLSHSYDLNYLILVQVLKSRAPYDFVVVFFSEQQTCLFKSFAIKCVGIFEDLAHVFNVNALA